jgi:LysM repeat protein
VDPGSKHRRPKKIRRTGRHATPSQVEKVAEKAGKAAPAMAIAGVLVAAPQVHAAVRSPAKATPVAERAQTEALVRPTTLVRQTQPANRSYTVNSGDTLSAIAQRFYGNPADWPWLYHVNASTVADPNLIYVGQKLQVPYDPPANAASYTPKHSRTATLISSATSSSDTNSSDTSSSDTDSSATSSSGTSSSATSSSGTSSSGASSSGTTLSGTLGCSGLEALWEAAGGSHAEAFMAAEIAMAESGGQQYAVSPTNDYGYWQINGSHGALATFNPIGNANAAIIISNNGSNWDPWTTYVTGAYQGRC